jgi:hypothetical protein
MRDVCAKGRFCFSEYCERIGMRGSIVIGGGFVLDMGGEKWTEDELFG